MKTIVYIDGFNLYYGSLKDTKNKWLDLSALFTKILKPHHEIVCIKYFTANVVAREGNNGSAIRQQAYIQALEASTPRVKVHRGHFLSSKVKMRLVTPAGSQKYAEVIKTEEKGSDVNLAIHALNDAWLDSYECAVVVSNDSDLSEALRIIKQDLKKKIILVTPGNPKDRPPSNELKRWAFASISITSDDLAACQLPNPVTTEKATFRKPGTW